MSQTRKFWRFKKEKGGCLSGYFLHNHVYEEDVENKVHYYKDDVNFKLDQRGSKTNAWQKKYFEEWTPQVGDYIVPSNANHQGCKNIRITKTYHGCDHFIMVKYEHGGKDFEHNLDLKGDYIPECCRAPYKESATTMLPADVGPCSEPGIAIPPEIEIGDIITERMFLWAKSRVDDFPPLDENGNPMVKQSYLQSIEKDRKRKIDLARMSINENRLALARSFEKTNPSLSETPEICIVFLNRLTKG